MNDHEPRSLIGQRIIDIRPLSPDELADEGWDEDVYGKRQGAVCFVLSDQTLLYAYRDEEGNGPGLLSIRTPDGRVATYYARDE